MEEYQMVLGMVPLLCCTSIDQLSMDLCSICRINNKEMVEWLKGIFVLCLMAWDLVHKNITCMYSQVLYRKYPTVSCDGKLHVDVALNPSDIINWDVMQNL